MEVLGNLRCGDGARAAHGLLDGGAHGRVELLKRGGHRLGGHAQMLGTHMVELLLEVAQRRGAAGLDIVEDRLDQFGGLVGAHLGTRHGSQHLGTGEALASQINDSHRRGIHTCLS